MQLEYTVLKEGQPLEPVVKAPISRVQLAKYAGASGDFNPIHLDDDFARKAGMDGVIAHGMLNMGVLAQYVSTLAGDEADVVRLRVRFSAVSKPGDVITCSGKVARVYEESGARYAALEVRADRAPDQPVVVGEAVVRFG